MGTVIHDAVIVTGWDEDRTNNLHGYARTLFDNRDPERGRVGCLVSEIIHSTRNGYQTFVIAPPGSKLGWGIHEEHESRLDEFCARMDEYGGVEYVRVVYGETEPQIKESR